MNFSATNRKLRLKKIQNMDFRTLPSQTILSTQVLFLLKILGASKTLKLKIIKLSEGIIIGAAKLPDPKKVNFKVKVVNNKST